MKQRKPIEHPKGQDTGDSAESEQAPDYWTEERLKKAEPISFPDGPPNGPPPSEAGDDGPNDGPQRP